MQSGERESERAFNDRTVYFGKGKGFLTPLIYALLLLFYWRISNCQWKDLLNMSWGLLFPRGSFQVYSINDMRYAKGQQRRSRTLGHCCGI